MLAQDKACEESRIGESMDRYEGSGTVAMPFMGHKGSDLSRSGGEDE